MIDPFQGFSGIIHGGILVTLVGPGIAIAIDGLTFLVAGSLIYLLIRFDKPNQDQVEFLSHWKSIQPKKVLGLLER